MATSYKVALAASYLTLAALCFSAGWLLGNAPASAPASPQRELPPVILGAAIAPVAEEPLPAPTSRLSFLWNPPVREVRHTVYGDLIQKAAERHAVSPRLVEAVMRVESDFDPLVVSHKGARGLMQVMPATGERFGVKRDELFNPDRNIAAGTAYLAWLLRRYKDVDLALAAYNAGEGAVDRYGGIPPYKETRTYVRKVRAVLRSHG